MRRWLAIAPVCPSRAAAVASDVAGARGLASRTSPTTEPTSNSATTAKGGGSAPVAAAGLAPTAAVSGSTAKAGPLVSPAGGVIAKEPVTVAVSTRLSDTLLESSPP